MNYLLLNQILLSEGLFDILSTLKRAFSNFNVNVTKRGLTINADKMDLESIYDEILAKAKQKGFSQVKSDLDKKFEFVSGSEIFTVSKPVKDKTSWKIELAFNTEQ